MSATRGWDCVACGTSLGSIENGVLTADVDRVVVDGNKVIVHCPDCGATKVWYVSDRLTNIANEIAEEFKRAARRSMVNKVG